MDKRKFIGKVTETERNEIKKLFERKVSLFERFKISDAENRKVYDKNAVEMGKASYDFQKWWDEKSKQYKWTPEKGFSWEIDFDTCDIYLVRK